MRGREFPETSSSDVSGRFLRVLRVLKERNPKQIRHPLQLTMGAMSYNL